MSRWEKQRLEDLAVAVNDEFGLRSVGAMHADPNPVKINNKRIMNCTLRELAARRHREEGEERRKACSLFPDVVSATELSFRSNASASFA